MSKKRKRISRRRLAGQRVMSHVPIFHLGTGQHKPVTAARRFIAEEGINAPAILNVRRNEHTTCLLYTSPSPRDQRGSRMPSSA